MVVGSKAPTLTPTVGGQDSTMFGPPPVRHGDNNGRQIKAFLVDCTYNQVKGRKDMLQDLPLLPEAGAVGRILVPQNTLVNMSNLVGRLAIGTTGLRSPSPSLCLCLPQSKREYS